MKYRATFCAAAIMMLLVMGGCGNGAGHVEGVVTLDNVPVAGGPELYGTVSFYPEGGGGAPAVGVVDSAGRYSLKTGAQDGVAPGSYLVSIALKKVTPPSASGGMPQATLISPKKYSSVTESGLSANVQPGSNSIDFALVSK